MTRRHASCIVAILFQGKMQATDNKPMRPDRANFVICCNYGDWSGFRTLSECTAQYAELERYATNTNRPDGYYWVEER